MGERSNMDAAIVWESGAWRCHHRFDSDGEHWLELYRGGELAVSRPIRAAEQLATVAESWKASLVGSSDEFSATMAEPTRRRFGPRRKTFRGGRRYDDPDEGTPTDYGPM